MRDFSLRGILKKQFLDQHVKDLQPVEPVTILTNVSARSAMESVAQSSVGCVLVVGEDDMLQGIFTERDVFTKLALEEEDSLDSIPVSQVMTPNPATIKPNASVARAIHMLSSGGYRHLPVIHAKEYPVGMLSAKNVVQFVYRNLAKEHESFDCDRIGVDQLVEQFFCSTISILKPSRPVTVPETASLFEVVGHLQSSSAGAVLVVSPQGTLSGIFTERDFINKIMLKELNLRHLPVVPYMTRDVKTVTFQGAVTEAVNIFWRGGFHHIPLIDRDKKPVALLTVRHFLKCLADSIVHDLNEQQIAKKKLKPAAPDVE